LRLRSWTLQEPETDRREHRDNSDVYHQPCPELVPEEQDVHANYDGDQREHVKRDGCLPAYRSFGRGSTVAGMARDAVRFTADGWDGRSAGATVEVLSLHSGTLFSGFVPVTDAPDRE
jgi:hypothetical protein